MADTPVQDPLAVWRDMMTQWEKGVNALANQTMASDEFSGSMNQAMSFMLRMQKTMAETMAASLTTLNLPNRGDVERIGERLQSVETRMDRVLALLETSATHVAAEAEADAGPNAAMPRRTKRPPSKTKEEA